MVFIEALAFSRHVASYLDDDGYRRLQLVLAANPDAGAVIPGTGGFRKMRWPDPRRGKGTRSGLRVIYFHFSETAQIWLMTLYAKDELDDLSAEEKRRLKWLIDLERRQRRKRGQHIGRRR